MAFSDIFRRKNGNDMTAGVIDVQTINKAAETLEEYRNGKKVLEQKTIENEDFWKQRQYECYMKPDKQYIPASPYLWNCIVNKHSDLVSSYPKFNIRPQRQENEAEAKVLSDILPIVLEQAEYRKTYSRVARYKVIQGTGITGVFWNAAADNGLGKIEIKKCDLLNLFWEPGVTSIQDSPNLFSVSLVNTELLDTLYPEHKGKFGKGARDVAHYNYDDTVDTSKKSMVIEWYYKKKVGDRDTVQYCKFVNNVILHATENETSPVTDEMGQRLAPPIAETGLYSDAKYPFVFDALFATEGTPAGYGYTDVGKDTQIQIDMLNNAITRNALIASKPRWLCREDVAVNLGEFLDWDKDVIRVAATDVSDIAIKQVNVNPLGAIYVNVLNSRINELKETLGNRDVNSGGTVAGVTTASGIAALQEAGGRIDKASTQETYFAQCEVIQMVLSRIKQFYTTPRVFRMLDANGEARYVEYVSQRDAEGFPELPYFDIDITPEKASPYKAISQNELMLSLYGAGIFNPSNAQTSIALLKNMDFDGSDKLIQSIQENNVMTQQLVKLATLVDKAYGTNVTEQLGISAPNTSEIDAEISAGSKEPAHMQKARERAQEASQPI